MTQPISVTLRPTALKVHSVVYKGESKQGQQLSIYIPWEIIQGVSRLPAEAQAGVESLPLLKITFEESEG